MSPTWPYLRLRSFNYFYLAMFYLGFISLFYLVLVTHCLIVEAIFFVESSNIEAIALYDFDSRTGRELSFKKGDLLVLKRRLSENWWEGLNGTQQGLVPDRYVTKNRERFVESNFSFILILKLHKIMFISSYLNFYVLFYGIGML